MNTLFKLATFKTQTKCGCSLFIQFNVVDGIEARRVPAEKKSKKIVERGPRRLSIGRTTYSLRTLRLRQVILMADDLVKVL